MNTLIITYDILSAPALRVGRVLRVKDITDEAIDARYCVTDIQDNDNGTVSISFVREEAA